MKILARGPATKSKLRRVGSQDRIARLIGLLEDEGKVESVPVTIRGNVTVEYRKMSS